jgi:hypothetical protein
VLWCTHLAEVWWIGNDDFAGRVFISNGTAALEILLEVIVVFNTVRRCLQIVYDVERPSMLISETVVIEFAAPALKTIITPI